MPGGIWNAEILPVLEWEVAECRVVVPEDLEILLGFAAPVLRWAKKKHAIVTQQHERDRHVIAELTRYLSLWTYVGEETGPHTGNKRVLLQDELQRWYAISIGFDATGSANVITVSGSGTKGFLANRLRGLRNVAMNEKWPSARPPCPGVS